MRTQGKLCVTLGALAWLAGCTPDPSYDPVADAGDDIVVSLGTEGVLDGTASFDHDGSVATYEWTVLGAPEESSAELQVETSLAILTPDVIGSWTLGLVVTDDEGKRSIMDVASIHGVPAGEPPTAVLSATGALGVGAETTLDASASFDPEGEALSYAFEVVIAPGASIPTLSSDPSQPYATFVPDVEGFYILGVTVDDGTAKSTRADVELMVTSGTNTAPVADCGSALEVEVSQAAQLDGSGSFDPEDDPLSFSWELSQAPEDSTATLDDPSLVSPTLIPDVEGVWYARLTVNDGSLSSAPCETTIQAGESGANNAPLADAGPDQSATVGVEVSVDSSGSSDPDGDPLTSSWTFASLPGDSSLSDADLVEDGPSASFTPDVEGFFELELSVCDEEPLCDTDTVLIEATSAGNTAPIADAGADQAGDLGDTFTLDGSASSDADGDSLSFLWAIYAQPAESSLTDAEINTAGNAVATVTPDVEGTFHFELEVCDGTDCDTDRVVVEVGGVLNNPPIADAGSDSSVTLGASVSLDGTGSSDPDGDPLSYAWVFNTKPTGSALTYADISDRSTALPSFTPDVAGDYILRLSVDDGNANDTDTVLVEVLSSNSAPLADAGTDLSVAFGNTVTLDGTGSSDPDGDPLTYSWIFTQKPTGSTLTYVDISDRTTATPNFTPDVVGDYTLRLRVNDGSQTDEDTVQVTVTQSNTAPVADAGADVSACELTEISLDGSASSDPDGDPLSYAWVFNSKPSTSSLTYTDIGDRTTATPSFTPDVAGTYVLRLTVDDGTDSDFDTVQIDLDFDEAVLVLHLDEASGINASDSGPSSLSVTVDQGEWQGALFFGGLAFNGEQITVPDGDETDLQQDFSIEWWMRATPGNSTYQGLFLKGGSYSAYSIFRYLDTSFYITALDADGNTTTGVVSGASFDDDWHHYAVVVDSSHAWTVYEDGVSLGTVAGAAAVATNNADLVIGGHPSFAPYDFHGVLDEIIIRDTAMSSTEVSTQAAATTQWCTGDSDTTAPSINITTPSSTTDQSYVAIEGTTSDESEIVSVTVDGFDALSTSGDFDTWVAFVPLNTGSNTLSATAEDVWGYSTTSSSVSVTYNDDCYDDYVLLLAFDDDGSGTAEDYSPRANDGTDSGVDRVIGVYGNAARFDGSASITVPDANNLDLTGRFTIDLWYASEPTSDIEVIAAKGLNYVVLLEDDDIYCVLLDGSGSEQVLLGEGLNDGDWHHVTCSWNLSQWRMFVDGAKEDDLPVTNGPAANGFDLVLGFEPTLGGYGYNGLLDGFRIHKGTSVALNGANSLRTEGEVCVPSSNLGDGASAEASDEASTNYAASGIIDGEVVEDDYSDETYWLLPQNTTGWVEVDLGGIYGITMLRWANTHHGPRYNRATEDYEILISTTGAFEGEETTFDSGSGSLETDLLFHQVESSSPVPGRYVRITVDSFHSLGGGLNELEVFGL